jgi:hypothetical protein
MTEIGFGFRGSSILSESNSNSIPENFDPNFEEKLLSAVASGDLTKVKHCFTSSNHLLKNRNSALARAVFGKSMDIVKYLVEVQNYQVDNNNRAIFTDPECYNKLEIIEYLLSRQSLTSGTNVFENYYCGQFLRLCMEKKLMRQLKFCLEYCLIPTIKSAIDCCGPICDPKLMEYVTQVYHNRIQADYMLHGRRFNILSSDTYLHALSNPFTNAACEFIDKKDLPALKQHFTDAKCAYKTNNDLLARACITGYAEMVDYLLSLGYVTDSLNHYGLNAALTKGHSGLFKKLFTNHTSKQYKNYTVIVIPKVQFVNLVAFVAPYCDEKSKMLAYKMFVADDSPQNLPHDPEIISLIENMLYTKNNVESESQNHVVFAEIKNSKSNVKIWDCRRLLATFRIKSVDEITASYSKSVITTIINKILSFDLPSGSIKLLKKTFSMYGLMICNQPLVETIITCFCSYIGGRDIYGESESDIYFILNYFIKPNNPSQKSITRTSVIEKPIIPVEHGPKPVNTLKMSSMLDNVDRETMDKMVSSEFSIDKEFESDKMVCQETIPELLSEQNCLEALTKVPSDQVIFDDSVNSDIVQPQIIFDTDDIDDTENTSVVDRARTRPPNAKRIALTEIFDFSDELHTHQVSEEHVKVRRGVRLAASDFKFCM